MAAQFDDRWSRWLLDERFGGDETVLQRTLQILAPIRDRVLSAARITGGEVVVDVGCGDGLLGFAALPLVGEDGEVVFVDVSAELLERCRSIASDLGVVQRCRFIEAGAETLEGVTDTSADVVMTRSVLIYVSDKASAFDAFHRVLKPGGRVSLFEPINRRITALNENTLFGYDASPVADLAAKVTQVYEAASPPDGAMMGFDETDLLYLAEDAGFSDINVTLELSSSDQPSHVATSWSQLLETAPNPNAPTYGKAIRQALTGNEASRLEQHFRPLIDDQGDGGRSRSAHA